MIYEKKLLNTLLKYDTETEQLFRFNKIKKCFTLVDPDISYIEHLNRFVYNKIEIDRKMFSIYRLIYFVCKDNFDIFDTNVTIDHRNVNHLDNKLDNLRMATMAEQTRNRLYKNGELVRGFTKLKRGIKRYMGYYRKNGKTITKCFLTESEAKCFHDNNTERF